MSDDRTMKDRLQALSAEEWQCLYCAALVEYAELAVQLETFGLASEPGLLMDATYARPLILEAAERGRNE